MSRASFEIVERVADAVLFEGYVLYPYRASAAKNQYRWQFGVVAPRAPRDDGEPWFAQTECIIRRSADPDAPAAALSVRVRFLRPESTSLREGRWWLEGLPHSIDLPAIPLQPLPASSAVSLGGAGVAARLTIDAEEVDGFTKVRLRVENVEGWREEFEASRDALLRRSLVGTHLLLAIENGRFESLLDAADAARAAAARCTNLHTWPVLAGDRAECNVMLSSPIVLYDFPAVARESQGDLCDATEIDEILTLRILTLTDEEKTEARNTDPRAREIVDRVESIHPAELAVLHGTMRSADFFNPPGSSTPEEASVLVEGQRVARGSHVRLRPNRRADSMDMFLRNQPATVAGVYRDVDDRVYVAVTVDADPAAALHESFGRFFYFDPAEVEPIPDGTRQGGCLPSE